MHLLICIQILPSSLEVNEQQTAVTIATTAIIQINLILFISFQLLIFAQDKGFEPLPSVLETDVLTVNTNPIVNCGRTGIRTLGTFYRPTVFKTVALNLTLPPFQRANQLVSLTYIQEAIIHRIQLEYTSLQPGLLLSQIHKSQKK